MPFFPAEQEIDFRPDVTAPLPEPVRGDTAAAAFRQDNFIVSFFNDQFSSGQFEPVAGHNPLDMIRGKPYEANHIDSFLGSRSPAETQSIMDKIDQEERDKQLLAGAGLPGVALQMVAGMLDPTILLPAGVLFNTMRAGRVVSGVVRAAEVGAAGFVQSSIQEAALQGTQETRTATESLLNVGSATILSALIGGAAGLLTKPEAAALTKAIDGERAKMDAHAAVPDNVVPFPERPAAGTAPSGVATAAGAAAADTRKVELAPAFGVEKVTAGFDPMSRLLSAESVTARRAAVDLAETPLMMSEAAEGVAVRQGAALDREVRLAINSTRVGVADEFDRLFSEYRFGPSDVSVPRLRAQFERVMGRDEGYMTYGEFKREVAKALQEGDKHDIPQVAQAAQFVRTRVFEPWKNRAIEAGLLDKDVDVKTAESFFQRSYDKTKISAQRPQFVDRVTGWLKSDQATKAEAQQRLLALSKEMQGVQDALAKAKTDERKASLGADQDRIREMIEKEIAAWEGKSVSEAKSAMKSREKYRAESEAAGGKPGEKGRLIGADDAIDAAVQRILKSNRDLSDAELRSRADEITNRILGSPDGRLPYDIANDHGVGGFRSNARGSLQAREFMIPDALIRDFLDSDVERVVQSHLRTMVPDVLLTERFGDVNLTGVMKNIEDEYAKLAEAARGNEKKLAKIDKERQRVIGDLAAIRDRIRGVYAYSSDPFMQNAARIGNAVKNYNVVVSMGSATISSLSDLAGPIFRNGLGTTFRDGWTPFFKMLSGDGEAWKAAKRQYRAMGIVTETTLSSRHHALDDIVDYHPQSRVEHTLQWGADRFQLVNFLAQWTDWGKTTASVIAGAEILRAAEAAAKGTATAKQITNLAASGIDRQMASRIWRQFDPDGDIKAGAVQDGVYLPNTADWKDAPARSAFEGAVGREADIAIITPGQEKPLWMSHGVISVLGQFKSFTAASTQRVLLANLQKRDAAALQGLMFSLTLGMLSYKLNSVFAGQKTSDRPQDWVKEGFSRSGMFGWFEEGNAFASKMSRGGLDVYRMIGADKPLSRYASRSAIDQVLGPTVGKVESMLKVTGAATSRDWAASDTHALRRLSAFQNLFYVRRLFDAAEAGTNNVLGAPERHQ